MKNTPKKSRIKSFVQKYDFTLLKKEIESYGYTYSFKNFALSSLLYLAVVAAIAYYIKLKVEFIIVLALTVVLLIPFVIRSQFNQMYQIKRFDMVTNYLDNIIPIFKRNPIITSAWKEVLDLVEGDMKECVEKALATVLDNTDDPHVMKSAFKIIEDRFPNSRIYSVHQMMLSIEKRNTRKYITSVDNMWLDVQSWISRITMFQKELKDRKSKLTFLVLITMASNCLFVSMYSSNDVFKSFTDNTVYQVSSTLFMMALIIVLCTFQIRLNGKWLIDDKTTKTDKKALKSFQYIIDPNNIPEILFKDKMLGLAFLILAVAFYIKTTSLFISLLIIYVAYLCYTQNRRKYKMHVKNVKKYLTVEFPTWLRDVSLNLQNLTVINAIESSQNTSTPIMNHYITAFLDDIYNNPTKIKPFNDFLDEFKIQGVKSSMKVLYSLQSLDKNEVQQQTNNLIIRNQELLEKAERIKNENSVSGLKILGFVPVGIFIAQMLVSMGLLFSVMMELMSGKIAL